MNKKGFTLVELIVSIVLLLIVSSFMMNLLVQLKTKEKDLEYSFEMELNSAFISKMINGSVVKNGGINDIECTSSSCEIQFNNNSTRFIDITNDNKTLVYRDEEKEIIARTLPSGTYKNISLAERTYGSNILRIITLDINDYSNYRIEIVDF